MDGAFAVCVLVTLAFGAFIVWGRSASGRQALRQTLGEPTRRSQPPSVKNLTTRRTAAKSPARTVVKKSSNQNTSNRAASAPAAGRKTSPATASPQKPTGKPRSGSPPRSRKP